MRHLTPGFDLDDEGGLRIVFSCDDAEVLSTCGSPADGCRGICFGNGPADMLSMPFYGKESCYGASVMEYDGTTRVAAVAVADIGRGHVRAGERPDTSGGGISLVLMIDADVPVLGTSRAMVTATEAITAVIRELGIGNNGRGTSSGMVLQDMTVVCRRDSKLRLLGTGKHSKLGELIGRTTIEAVTRSAECNGVSNETVKGSRLPLLRLGADFDIPDGHDPILLALLHVRDEIVWGVVTQEEGLEAARRMASAYCGKEIPKCGSVLEIVKAMADNL
ncbi:hypothetical protein TALC_01133 [Thermoplasmatales archaeon BRNA1]|nr:hypothetical protein TALC_01133 [Thermoplasmatales archaeon BRNA1]